MVTGARRSVHDARARSAGGQNGAVSEQRDAASFIFVSCDSARGGTPGPRCQLSPRARTGSSRTRYGVVPRTDDQPLSHRYGPAGRVLTKEHTVGAPSEHETRRGGMNPAVPAEPLTNRAPLLPMDLARRWRTPTEPSRPGRIDGAGCPPPREHRRAACPQQVAGPKPLVWAARRTDAAAPTAHPRHAPRDSRRVGLARMAWR